MTALNLNNETNLEQTKNWQKVTDEKNNISVKIPPGFELETPKGSKTSLLSDKKPANLGLNLEIYGEKLPDGTNIEEVLKSSPLLMNGMVLDLQPINFPGYSAFVQVFGTTNGDSSQRIILIRNGWMWQFKAYPGNSVNFQLTYDIISTFEPLNK